MHEGIKLVKMRGWQPFWNGPLASGALATGRLLWQYRDAG